MKSFGPVFLVLFALLSCGHSYAQKASGDTAPVLKVTAARHHGHVLIYTLSNTSDCSIRVFRPRIEYRRMLWYTVISQKTDSTDKVVHFFNIRGIVRKTKARPPVINDMNAVRLAPHQTRTGKLVIRWRQSDAVRGKCAIAIHINTEGAESTSSRDKTATDFKGHLSSGYFETEIR